jgi:hypothetical protein
VQIKAEYNQLFEMAIAFGVRVFGTALLVNLYSTDFRDKGPEWASSPTIAAESKLTTKAVPSTPALLAPPIYAQASDNKRTRLKKYDRNRNRDSSVERE